MIVGYRPWKINITGGKLRYSIRAPTDSYNIILSDALLIHKKYLHLYSKNSPALLYNEIHSHFNGDKFSRDVLLNIIVAQHLKNEKIPQSPCLWIKAKNWKSRSMNWYYHVWYIYILGLIPGLVSDGDTSVWTKRSKFLAQIEQIYGHNLSLYDSNRILSRKEDIILRKNEWWLFYNIFILFIYFMRFCFHCVIQCILLRSFTLGCHILPSILSVIIALTGKLGIQVAPYVFMVSLRSKLLIDEECSGWGVLEVSWASNASIANVLHDVYIHV